MSATKPVKSDFNENKLWRSPLGAKWFIVLVMIALILTIIKFYSSVSFITKTYQTSGDKEISYDFFNLIMYGCWLIGPPLFFLIEYTFIFGKDENRRMDPIQVADLKYCHDLASKVWAGVGVFLSMMLLVKYGIKF